MEGLELLNYGVASIVGAIVLAMFRWLNNREKHDADSDARQEGQITALTTAIQSMATVSAASIEQSQANTATLKALTEAIMGLQACEDETQTMVAGMRRDQQTLIASELERHEELLSALAPLPDIQTAVKGIQATWPKDFRRIGEALSDLKSQNQEQGTRIDTAFQEWQTTGTRILMYLEEEHTRRAEGADTPPGEGSIAKPESTESNTSSGSQSDSAAVEQSTEQHPREG